MNDVIPVLTLGCNLFLTISAGIALLAFSKACVAYAKHPKVTAFVSGTKTEAGGWALTAPIAEALPASEPEPTPEPTPEPDIEEIECGACHRVIKSEPIQQIMGNANTPPSEIYQCESCKAQVQVPI